MPQKRRRKPGRCKDGKTMPKYKTTSSDRWKTANTDEERLVGNKMFGNQNSQTVRGLTSPGAILRRDQALYQRRPIFETAKSTSTVVLHAYRYYCTLFYFCTYPRLSLLLHFILFLHLASLLATTYNLGYYTVQPAIYLYSPCSGHPFYVVGGSLRNMKFMHRQSILVKYNSISCKICIPNWNYTNFTTTHNYVVGLPNNNNFLVPIALSDCRRQA
jgi:hypothetical protein